MTKFFQNSTTNLPLYQKSQDEMFSLGKSWDEIKQINNIKYHQLEKMIEYVESKKCRRKFILEYFVDPDLKNYQHNCRGCDVCLNFKWQNASVISDIESVKEQKFSPLRSDTVMETVKLYKQNYSPSQIAKARSLGESTIFNHLIKWYLGGGELEVEKFITPQEEQQILLAMSKAKNYQRLKLIKDYLPKEISYEKIRLVIAKIQRVNLR
ncbi:MAG: helix-turn-helix domain-containing protein [Patescibacteria group bacterium]